MRKSRGVGMVIKKNKYPIEAQKDYIEKVAQAKPTQAIAELVWNSLDADATKVNVSFIKELGYISKIEISDDGFGMPRDRTISYFKGLGGSWKQLKRISEKGRMLHGKEGKGRFKAKALGRVCDWETTYKENNDYYTYTLSIVDNFVEASDKKISEIKKSGTKVVISELCKDYSRVFDKNSNAFIQELTEIFALYLKAYKDISIYIENEKLDVRNAIKSQIEINLPNIIDENNEEFSASLEVIEWKRGNDRKIYLCDKNGFPLSTVTGRKLPFGNFMFSGYLKSDYVTYLQKKGTLDIHENEKALENCINVVVSKLKELYRKKLSEDAQTIVEKWKKENSYPYSASPTTLVEEATRQVFDIVAVNVSNNIPDFMEGNTKSRALQLRLIKEIVEKSPEDLQEILSSVLDLTPTKRKELADLLKNTSLSTIISIANKVSNRLNFINGLEELIFNDKYKKGFKERTQLQKLLEENTWFFGEEYNLLANDESLTTVLKKYTKLHKLNVSLDESVESYRNKKQDIIDLMFAKVNRRCAPNEIENLVIELKSPKQPTLTALELSQIEGYALAVAKDERFHGIPARWNFIVISNEMDENVKNRANQKDRPRGLITDNGCIKVWAKTWSEFILENKERHNFLKKAMGVDLTKNKSLEYLRVTHSEILKDLISPLETPEDLN